MQATSRTSEFSQAAALNQGVPAVFGIPKPQHTCLGLGSWSHR